MLGPNFRIKKNESTPPPWDLKHLVACGVILSDMFSIPVTETETFLCI